MNILLFNCHVDFYHYENTMQIILLNMALHSYIRFEQTHELMLYLIDRVKTARAASRALEFVPSEYATCS